MKKIIIVTGANGFLGNNLIRSIDKNEYEVRAIYHNDSSNIDELDCLKYHADILDINSLDEVFTVPKTAKVYVIHAAANIYIGAKYNQSVYDTNVNGTKNIVKKCLEINARLIYINSVHSIYKMPNPVREIAAFDQNKVSDLYAKTKAIAAKYVLDKVKEKNLDAVILQPSSILGPYNYSNDYLIEMIRMVASKNLTFGIKGGYDFVDVRDVTNGVLNSLTKGKKGECYILSGHYETVMNILNMVCDTCKLEPIKHKIPLFLIKINFPFISLYYKITKKPALFSRNSIKILQEDIRFSNEKASKELNYSTRDLKDTIKDTVKWLKDNKMI